MSAKFSKGTLEVIGQPSKSPSRSKRLFTLIGILATIIVITTIVLITLYANRRNTEATSEVHPTNTTKLPILTTTTNFETASSVIYVTNTTIEATTTITATTTATIITTTATQKWVPLRASSVDIHPNAKWSDDGLTVAGGNGYGGELNQLSSPRSLYVDDDQTIYVVDQHKHRIVEWKDGATSGQVVAGGNGRGNETYQLNFPTDVIVDKDSDSLIIADFRNRRVVRWPRRNGTDGEIIISNIDCIGLTMDENGFLYVVNGEKHEARRYRIGDTEGTVIAGSNGNGSRLDQMSYPFFIFVDRDHSVYVSDTGNQRVMKWEEDANQGIVVAGGQGEGNSLTQLNRPGGVVVDQLGTVYVVDGYNHRIMRWPKGATEGIVIAGGNDHGEQSNQLSFPTGLSFDRYGNVYATDDSNNRVQKFNIEQTINS